MTQVTAIFIAANILVVLIVIVRMYYFTKHNPAKVIGGKFTTNFIYRLVYSLADEWSSVIFWMCFFVTLYFFVMYKLQTNAYLLLPSVDLVSSAYDSFKIVFFITLASKTLAVLMKIYDQSTADIFLIDWEHPRKISAEDTEESVVAWRFTFMANELDEL